MRRDLIGHASGMAAALVGGGLSALRILVQRSPWPWTKRPFIGEPFGVWLLGSIWVLLVVVFITLSC